MTATNGESMIIYSATYARVEVYPEGQNTGPLVRRLVKDRVIGSTTLDAGVESNRQLNQVRTR